MWKVGQAFSLNYYGARAGHCVCLFSPVCVSLCHVSSVYVCVLWPTQSCGLFLKLSSLARSLFLWQKANHRSNSPKHPPTWSPLNYSQMWFYKLEQSGFFFILSHTTVRALIFSYKYINVHPVYPKSIFTVPCFDQLNVSFLNRSINIFPNNRIKQKKTY